MWKAAASVPLHPNFIVKAIADGVIQQLLGFAAVCFQRAGRYRQHTQLAFDPGRQVGLALPLSNWIHKINRPRFSRGASR